MARYSRYSARTQIFGFLFLLAGLGVGGLIWFDILGLVNARQVVAPALNLVREDTVSVIDEIDDALLLDRLRLERSAEAIELRATELDQQAGVLATSEQTLLEREQELAVREAEIEEREVSLNERLQQYDNRREVLEQISVDLTSMPPADAVEILVGYDDQLLIETLRVTEERAQRNNELSLVSFWLSQFPPERAAEIQRKMTLRPTE